MMEKIFSLVPRFPAKPFSEKEERDIFEIQMPKQRYIFAGIAFFGFGFIVSWIFYKILLLSILFGFFSLYFLKYYKKGYSEKIRERIEDEFYELNLLLSAELETGSHVNQAIHTIQKEIRSTDIYEFRYMHLELESWSKNMRMGLSLEKLLHDFAMRSEHPSIKEYADMVSICIKRGGNMRDVIKNTNDLLLEKRELKKEIEVLTAEKRLEQRVMNLMPIVVLLMMDKTAPEFIAPLYSSVIGRITMSILLLIFVLCFLWSSKISKLE